MLIDPSSAAAANVQTLHSACCCSQKIKLFKLTAVSAKNTMIYQNLQEDLQMLHRFGAKIVNGQELSIFQ
jgi:hypothetical protein